jgi:DNA-binding MarR family transcriptional regulator
MNKSVIKKRREKVAYYLVKGVHESDIAERLGVDRSTVVRDVAYIREKAKGWLDDLARDGFIHEYRLALEKIRDHESELQKLYDKTKSVARKVLILRALDENVKLYLELLGETPTVHAYKRALRKLQESKGDVQSP